MENTDYDKLEEEIQLRTNRLQTLSERGMEDELELEKLKKNKYYDKDYENDLKKDIEHCTGRIAKLNKTIQNLSNQQYLVWYNLNKNSTRAK